VCIVLDVIISRQRILSDIYSYLKAFKKAGSLYCTMYPRQDTKEGIKEVRKKRGNAEGKV
jgi:hypothetical protein